MTTKRQDQDNRRTPRFETAKGLWVAWRTDGAPSVSRVRDLSLGGVFITTRTPLSQGSAIKLLFSLPEGEMRIEGTVRYSNKASGMGVEFTQMGTADRARLRELIRRLNA
jgi:uncharacterized protein (TIGR02266 family)